MSGTISEYCLTTINGVRCLLPAGHAEPCRFMLGEACSGCAALRAEVSRLTRERDETEGVLRGVMAEAVAGLVVSQQVVAQLRDGKQAAEAEVQRLRAALLGLADLSTESPPCWCYDRPDDATWPHEPECIAARAVLNKEGVRDE